jgi:hypothetical protein
MCANATPAGHFGPSRQVAAGRSLDPLDMAPMIFGRADSAAIVTSTFNDDTLVNSLVTVGAGCEARSPELLDPAAWPRRAMSDARGRIWLLGQSVGGVSHRAPLLLTITAPIHPPPP